jgi:CheY-like chemotaxis protein
MLAGELWAIHADHSQLENALLNLAINARDAMPDGGSMVMETANTTLDDTGAAEIDAAPGQYVVIAVSDTGIGMPREVIEQAFQPFFTTKAAGQGTGLGLTQVYTFAKQCNGRVAIDSELGKGTIVKLYFPCFAAEIADAGSGTTVGSQNPSAASGFETVLVVEDDRDVRGHVVEALGELGYRVLEAAEGAAALRVLNAEPDIALLFVDAGLPGQLDGIQLAEEARRQRPLLRVLFTTAYPRNAIVQGRLDPGAALIAKPFTHTGLATHIRQALARG